MDLKRNATLFLVMGVMSLVGGMLSHWVMSGTEAQAAKIETDLNAAAQAPGAARSEVLVARRIMILDGQNRVRAELGVGADNAPRMTFIDADGAVSSTLGMLGNGMAVFQLSGKDGCRLELTISPDGEPALAMADRKGRLRSLMSLSKEGEPLLGFQDENGKTRIVIGKVSMDRWTGEEKIQTQASSVTLFDDQEKMIWQAP